MRGGLDDTARFHILLSVLIHGRVKVAAVEEALNAVIARHSGLRAGFELCPGRTADVLPRCRAGRASDA